MREADIRPADLLATYLRLSAEDAKSIFARPTEFVPRPCPGCGLDDPKSAFTKNGFALVTCQSCASLYVSPAPCAKDLDTFYRDSPSTRYWANVFFPAVAEARRNRIFRPRAEKVARWLGQGARVVDVGSGSGLFIEELHACAAGLRARAVEPSADLAAACRNKGIETFEGFAQDAASASGWQRQADLVSSFEVIEHVLDPLEFVRSLGALARPGGLVLITGLCGTGFDIEVLQARSNAVFPPHHLNFLSRAGVTALAARAELELVEFSTPGQLDIDIVCNAIAEDEAAVSNPALRSRLISADLETRRRMQEELVAEGKSSHMWVIMRRQDEGASI